MGQVCNGACNFTDSGHTGEEVVKDAAVQQVLVPEQSESERAEKVKRSRKLSKLTLEIVSARGLRNLDWWPGYGKSDCYCVVKCHGKAVYTTNVIPDCLEPQWRETVEGMEWEEGRSLEFHLFDKDMVTSHFLGKVVLESQSFAAEGFNNEVQVREAGSGISAFLRLKIKVPGKDFPAGPATCFEIEINKGDALAWGLDLDAQDPKIISVSGIRAGPFKLYNQDAHPDKRLVENDFIKSVDGIEGNTPAMMNQFKSQKQLKLVVVRSREMTICLDLTDPLASIGLMYPVKPMGNSLVVLKILDSGVIPDYNRKVQDEALQIKESDRIVAARGVKGGAAYVQSELVKRGRNIQITLLRPTIEK